MHMRLLPRPATHAPLVAAYLEEGGLITHLRPRQSCGMSTDDWRSATRGEAYVTPAELKAAKIAAFEAAAATGDVARCTAIVQGRLDAAIKTDLLAGKTRAALN